MVSLKKIIGKNTKKTRQHPSVMIRINYPLHDFRIKEEAGKEWIFDELRKTWVWLSPEEWVRQNILQYLVTVKNYPASLIAVEKEIRLGELKKRFDILVYRQGQPWMILECKEGKVDLTDAVLKQVLNYHITLPTEYLVITNGTFTMGFRIENGAMEEIDAFPEYVT